MSNKISNKIKIERLLSVTRGSLSQPFMQWQKKGLTSLTAMVLLGSSYSAHAEFEIAETEFNQVRAEARAAHFLSQATMGSTHGQIRALANRMESIGYIEACEEWIDNQLAAPHGTSMRQHAEEILEVDGRPPGGILSFRNRIAECFDFAWWDHAINAPDKLRQRVSFAHSQTFVVSRRWFGDKLENNRYVSYSNYYTKLQENAFGTHRELLQEFAYDPFVGAYLTSAQNSKGDPEAGIFPDQSFAREVMQLHTCGVFDLAKDGTIKTNSNGELLENYDQEDIFEMSQVFTGLSLVRGGNLHNFLTTTIDRNSFLEPMRMVQNHHDTSTKHLLNGVVLPANQNGDKDISDTLDLLAEHSSTAPYQSIALIKRLTTSNPSTDYISRVVDVWLDTGGNFGQVVKAILLDPEARNAINYSMTGSGNKRIFRADIVDPLSGRLKEPVLKLTQFYAFCRIETDSPDGFIRLRGGRAAVQHPMDSPTAFNYYDTFYSPPSGPIGEFTAANDVNIVSPEMQLVSDYVITEFEQMYDVTRNARPSRYTYIGNRYTTTIPGFTNLNSLFNNTRDFVAQLDRALCNCQMPDEVAKEIANIMENTNLSRARKNHELATLIFSSADFSVSW